MTTDAEWWSDEALRKQAELKEWPEGTPPPLALLCGLFEPRTQPEPHERCVHCGSDARPQAFGATSKGRPFCGLCLGRGNDEDYEAPGGAA